MAILNTYSLHLSVELMIVMYEKIRHEVNTTRVSTGFSKKLTYFLSFSDQLYRTE